MPETPSSWIGVVALAISMIGTVLSSLLAVWANNHKEVALLRDHILRQDVTLDHQGRQLRNCKKRHRERVAVDRALARKVDMVDAKVDSVQAIVNPPAAPNPPQSPPGKS